MQTLDRYLLREFLPPFLLALGIFTFILDVMPMLETASDFLAKGVDLATVGALVLLLLPQALGLTLPTAFLTGLLMALGRWSGDREAMALLACGISPLRLLRPVLMAGAGVAVLTLYVMVWLLPQCNQRFNELSWSLLTQRTEQEIRPGLFYEGFPGKVLYLQASSPEGWQGVLVADTTQTGRPAVVAADRGRLILDRAQERVVLSLTDASQYAPGTDSSVYDTSRTTSVEPLTLAIAASEVFPGVSRGYPEMSVAELRDVIARERALGLPARSAYFYWQQMYAFPVACLVFAVLGLAIGLHTRKEGKLAGMTVGLAVVFLYYALLKLAETATKGDLLAPVWARWVPNLVLLPVGAALLWWRTRAPGVAGESFMPSALVTRLAGLWPRSRRGAPRRGPVTLPGVRVLDAYVGWTYLRILGLAFAGLMGLYYIGATLDVSDRLFKPEVGLVTIVRYLWYSTPQFATFVAPIATLIAVLGTIGGLTRTSELTVMRACGVSLYRAALPLVLLALVWSGVLFGLQERVVAGANRRASALLDTIRGRTRVSDTIDNRHWLADDAGRVFYYVSFSAGASPTLTGLSVFETSREPYRIEAHTFAREAVFRDGAWHAADGWQQQFGAADDTRTQFAGRVLDLPGPAVFGASTVDTETMTWGELRRHVQRLAASGFSVAEQQVRLHGKIAFPLVAVVMTLLAIPFGVTTGRRGALYGVGLAFALAVGYWLLAFFFMAVGGAGLLPAALAAWAANILFLTLALYLTLTVRT